MSNSKSGGHLPFQVGVTHESVDGEEVHIITLGFGSRQPNDVNLQDAMTRLGELIVSGQLPGGKLLKITGPAAISIAIGIGIGLHSVLDRYQTVAVYEPGLRQNRPDGRHFVVVHVVANSPHMMWERIK